MIPACSTSSSSTAAAAPAGATTASAPSTSPAPGSSPSTAQAAPAPAPAPASTGAERLYPTVEEVAAAAAAAAGTSETSTSSSTAASGAVDAHGLPALPAPGSGDEATTVIEVNGAAVSLDSLGPMVIGRDGTVSRIANWAEMVDIERKNTLRILGKRNQLRLANLRGEDAPDTKQ
ncbi:hypothetical protein B0T16DRAFT_386904 [Cercophora newfieldiana]|uniref:Uncharacterized protein n=1 Tax=Cercophora newfieldiana TaxID=92897 RepID=A0AA39YI67_9PEZI|nr:hypothetical protein B0T16DRAFT_386904 [Cercophora newfieldiana]